MADLIKLCKTDEVKEEAPLQVNPEGFPALSVWEFEGDYYVVDDMCTHGMAWMTDGYQEGLEIECPFHGGRFDLKSGEPTAFPCVVPLKSYPVTVDDGHVCITAA
ncbi:MAG: non-heme iron oxygenase ferredoxin subunit [Immundisolibacteraceae bacterium]|nr:non-heme iron oxygenase ferredoxin subunit [Immundisolibacteraceae bacterium]